MILQIESSRSIKYDIIHIRGNSSIFSYWYMDTNGAVNAHTILFAGAKKYLLFGTAVSEQSSTVIGTSITLRLQYK